jgi:hypothetical protein
MKISAAQKLQKRCHKNIVLYQKKKTGWTVLTVSLFSNEMRDKLVELFFLFSSLHMLALSKNVNNLRVKTIIICISTAAMDATRVLILSQHGVRERCRYDKTYQSVRKISKELDMSHTLLRTIVRIDMKLKPCRNFTA